MKIAIALACLVAFVAAVEETGQQQIDADLDVAENGYGGGYGGGRGGYGGGRGGYGGGRGGYGGGGHHGGRYGRSLEESQPIIMDEFQPEYVDYISDLQLAENRYSGGNYGSGGRRGRRSVEETVAIADDLQAAEHHSGGYRGHSSSGSSGYGNHGSSGYPTGGHGGHSGHGSQYSGHGRGY